MAEFLADIVDHIYEAAVITGVWPHVLDRIASIVEAPAGLIFTADGFGHARWLANPFFTPIVQRYVDGGFMSQNLRPQRFLAANHVGFINDIDVLSEEEIDADPAYARFMKPIGLGCTVGTVLPLSTGELLVFDFTRRLDRGPFERRYLDLLNLAQPHLARAGLLAARLRLEQARTAAATLAAIGLAGAVIAANGRVLAANELVEPLASQLQIGANDRLRLTAPEANRLLQECLDHSASNEVLRSIAVPATDERRALALHLVPLRRAALDIFSRAATLAVAMPVGNPIAPTIGLLAGLFDLTPAEARVARLLAGGDSVNDVAASLAISRETVRSHLKKVLAKTGTSRQAELVQLLAGTAAPVALLKPTP